MIVALIPARMGSQRIPRKNLQDVGGRALFEWQIVHARAASHVQDIIVSTDDPTIKDLCATRWPYVTVVDRPESLAGPNVSLEDVAAHALDGVDWTACVLLQPTSPLRGPGRINEACHILNQPEWDSCVGVQRNPLAYFKGYISSSGRWNYGYRRVNTQDLATYTEGGGIWGFKREGFLFTHNRIHGRVRPIVMSEVEALDIDTPDDLELARWHAERLKVAA